MTTGVYKRLKLTSFLIYVGFKQINYAIFIVILLLLVKCNFSYVITKNNLDLNKIFKKKLQDKYAMIVRIRLVIFHVCTAIVLSLSEGLYLLSNYSYMTKSGKHKQTLLRKLFEINMV